MAAFVDGLLDSSKYDKRVRPGVESGKYSIFGPFVNTHLPKLFVYNLFYLQRDISYLEMDNSS